MSKENLSAVRGLMAEINQTPTAIVDPEYDAVDSFMNEGDPKRTVAQIFFIMDHTVDYFQKASERDGASVEFFRKLSAVPTSPRRRRLW